MNLLRIGWIVVVLAGCSDDDGGSTSSNNATLTKCNALCDAQAKATDCTTPPDTKLCKDLCAAVVSSFNADCQAKASAYYDCGSKTTWKCAGSFGTQTTDPNACETQLTAYSACFKSTG